MSTPPFSPLFHPPEHNNTKHHSASFDINTPHHHRHFEASFERDSDRHHKHKHTEVNIELPRREHNHHHHHHRRHRKQIINRSVIINRPNIIERISSEFSVLKRVPPKLKSISSSVNTVPELNPLQGRPCHRPSHLVFLSQDILRRPALTETTTIQPRTPARSTFTEEVRDRELVKYSPPAPKSTTSNFKPVNLEMGYYDDEAGAPVVIRITTSAATGQHRYLGVDLFTRQLNEESSFIANPSPSVVVQTMLGPVFKQYRVLDLQDHTVVAMTETGDVKQAVPVLDQSNLWTRLKEAFEGGRGSIRIMVVADGGREIAVDMKTVHGSRL
ncbi:hypothetical protein EYC84_008600 [Monilinia fructicola]|uniref:Translation elongation factor IF5A C-terminal domain-containing protein n=1 Tax=Monilinia fructicola TaxID=38448 RepID=A0A5M9JME5_MONFR|nr:hypothetical protein EYC84_008600 [Monilinia fructicola]